MPHDAYGHPSRERPRSDWWRLAIIALGVLILCSCRGPAAPRGGANMQETAYPSLPPGAYTGAPAAMAAQACPPEAQPSAPLPYTATDAWRPPGIAGPWPADEYICDGGNAGPAIRVAKPGDVRGLEMEDTVAHYDTLDGRTLVEPSNRVCIYSPRFGSVRQVVNVEVDQQRNRAAGVALPERLAIPRSSQPTSINTQNFQAVGGVAMRPVELMRGRQGNGVVSNRLGPEGFNNHFRAYESASAIHRGVLVESEMAFLAKGVDAAVAWTRNQTVQVLLDAKAARVDVGSAKLQTFYTIDSPPPNPRLRVIKVASAPFAEPGEEVSFTIRFDNVGNQPIGHVTILDSLHTRLEYVAGSAQCSLEAKFATQPNEGDSVVVRCELTEPLKAGQGGVLRFRCRVR